MHIIYVYNKGQHRYQKHFLTLERAMSRAYADWQSEIHTPLYIIDEICTKYDQQAMFRYWEQTGRKPSVKAEAHPIIVTGLPHPMLEGMVTGILFDESGIIVTVDDRNSFLFRNANEIISVGGSVTKNQSRLDSLREIVKIQGSSGNWDHDPYMHGMYNGMVLALGTMEDKEPSFRDWPYTGVQYLWKRIKTWLYFKFTKPRSEGNADNRPISF